MALWLVKGKENSTTPWNDWQELIAHKPDPAKHFLECGSGGMGFAIARWDREGGILPSEYLFEVLTQNSADTGNFGWRKFGDDKLPETPLQYKTLKRTMKLVALLRRAYETERIGLILWGPSESKKATTSPAQ